MIPVGPGSGLAREAARSTDQLTFEGLAGPRRPGRRRTGSSSGIRRGGQRSGVSPSRVRARSRPGCGGCSGAGRGGGFSPRDFRPPGGRGAVRLDPVDEISLERAYPLVFQSIPEPFGIVAPVGGRTSGTGQAALQGGGAGVFAGLACRHEGADRRPFAPVTARRPVFGPPLVRRTRPQARSRAMRLQPSSAERPHRSRGPRLGVDHEAPLVTADRGQPLDDPRRVTVAASSSPAAAKRLRQPVPGRRHRATAGDRNGLRERRPIPSGHRTVEVRGASKGWAGAFPAAPCSAGRSCSNPEGPGGRLTRGANPRPERRS